MTEESRKEEELRRAPRPVQEMRLRASRPPVTRLSRKVLLGLGAVAATALGAALLFALKPSQQPIAPELYNPIRRRIPDQLGNLPRDYTGIPKPAPQLGPPLPGDLGKTILDAQAPVPGLPAPPVKPEEQRRMEEQEAARTSRLFVTRAASRSLSPKRISSTLTVSFSLTIGTALYSNSVRNVFRTFRYRAR